MTPSQRLSQSCSNSASLDPNRDPERIAFGSCFAPQIGKDAIWQGVLSQSPDLLLLLGDNVYQTEENGKPELKELRDAYRMLAAVEAFTQLRTSTPLMMTWDDHDYGMNDAGSEFSAKTQSQKLFMDVWAVPPDDQRRQRDGIYYAQTIGQPGPPDPDHCLRYTLFPVRPTNARTIPLLRDRSATWRIQIPIKRCSVKPNGSGWNSAYLNPPTCVSWFLRSNYSPTATVTNVGVCCLWNVSDLFNLIATTRANGLVVLSGDRHVAGYYRRGEGLPYAITELTASPFNMVIEGQGLINTLNEPGPRRLGELVGVENFGVVTFDWERSVLGLEIRDQAGALVRREEIEIADLNSPHEEPGGNHP